MAEPNPANVGPWYLRNINQALALDSATGNVYVRTGANITVGNITVGNVGITSFGNVPITGNTLPVTVAGGNVTVSQGTTPWVITGNVGVTGTSNVSISGTNLDAFGRLRVSEPYTLFDSQNLYIDGGQFNTSTTGGGSSTYIANESSFNLSVGTASGDSVIRQSWTTQAYQPGKSLLALNTFAFAGLKVNLRQRVGYFTANNGVFFEADGATLNMVIRSYVSGGVVEDRIAQASWNGDTLNGAGPSGITLDPTTTQIFWSDIEWLGVGNVRVGFIINGQYIVCHTFQHANQAGNTTVYMTTATLNPRYEITNTAATVSPSTMKQICSTVISEGGYNPSLTLNYAGSGTTTTRISAANTLTSVVSIRLNPAYPDAVVLPSQIDILSVDVRYGEFRIVEGATIAGATWSNVANSVVQVSTTAVTVSDGTTVYGGLTSSRSELTVSEEIARRLQLKRTVGGTPVILTLAAAYTQTNSDILWKFGWQELTN